MNRSLIAPLALTLAGAGLVAVYLIVEPSRASEWFAVAVPALAAVSILIAVAVHRPMRPIPWVLLALGLGAAATARAVAAHDWYGVEGLTFPGCRWRRTACSPTRRCSFRRSASRPTGAEPATCWPGRSRSST